MMQKILIVLVMILGGAVAAAQSPGFQPKGDDQWKALMLFQQADVEFKSMQLAQLEFQASQRRLQDIKTAQKNHEPALLKSLAAPAGASWDWDRMQLLPPPAPAATSPAGTGKPEGRE